MQDHAETDLLDTPDWAAHEGGLAAAAAAAGGQPRLWHGDTSDGQKMRLRQLEDEVARITRGRLTNPAWITAMQRHHYRGAAEIARAVAALCGFAVTLPSHFDTQFDLVFAATLGDTKCDQFLRDANPEAREDIRQRLEIMWRHGQMEAAQQQRRPGACPVTRALIIVVPHSGAGKTTVTLALLLAFKNAGLRVRAAKCGPDYIDPQFHAAITKAPCPNLDGWAMSPAYLRQQLARLAEGADLVLIEASMGLYDGFDAVQGCRGSAADLAALLQIPVMLVIDVRGQGQSAAMIASGFARWRDDVRLAGVWFNHIVSDRHKTLCAADLDVKLLGTMRRTASLSMPRRHLGLVQPSEYEAWRAGIEEVARQMACENNLDDCLDAACKLDIGRLRDTTPSTPRFVPLPPPGQNITVARDATFTFIYPHLLEAWRDQGANVRFFSPLLDEGPPEDCDACWLPGGYPELHAGILSQSDQFRRSIHAFARTRPVHGECGGYMVLGETLEDASGHTHNMLGLLSYQTSFARRKMTLGYREAHLDAASILGPKGTICRGHEFHYARVIASGHDDALATIYDGAGKLIGKAGGKRGKVSGSFFHVMSRRM